MLCTILTFGLILIFFDVTLIQLLFMMGVLVVVLPFILGILTVGEVRSGLAGMKKIGILKRLDEMKFFEKKTPAKEQKVPQKTEKTPQKPAKAPEQKIPGKAGGFGNQIRSIFSSFGSLGTILKEKSRRGKKVEDINKMLDKTVSEKVPARSTVTTAPAQTAAAPDTSLPAPGGAGGMTAGGADTDPFLSLSSDEFDAGLLDGIDDDSPLQMPEEIIPEGPVSGTAPDLPAPELSMPSMDAMPSPEGSPADTSSGLDEFSGLEGSGSMDAEFGDLDSLTLDGIDMDDETGSSAGSAAAPAESPEPQAPAAPAAAPNPDAGVVKTAWIASDAPAGADITEDQIGIQSDMASFAGGSAGTDEDLLSSIASDVKTTKKEKDLSLLRELKDFKAPATDIEDELRGMYQHLGGDSKKKEKTPPANGMK